MKKDLKQLLVFVLFILSVLAAGGCTRPTSLPSSTEAVPPVWWVEPPAINIFVKPGQEILPEQLDFIVQDGPIDWTAATDQPWLKLDPGRGGLAEADAAITLAFDASGMLPGEYRAEVTITEAHSSLRVVPVRLYITDIEIIDVAHISVSPAAGTAWENGIELYDGCSVTFGLLKDAPVTSWTTRNGIFYEENDQVFIIRGALKNTFAKDWHVLFGAVGLNGAGEEVSWTLDRAGILGQAEVFIPANEKREFILHQTWHDDVCRFEFFAYCYESSPP
jgi:hypothetical protein